MNGNGLGEADILKSKKSLGEIFDVALSFERTARDFYRELLPQVSKQIRYLVEELAQEEQRHLDLFSKMKDSQDLVIKIKQMIDIPVNDGAFSDAVHLPELGEKPDDQKVLQYAMWREHTAMEHYRALSKSTPQGAIRDLFTFLADEETRHKTELEKLYYELISHGGPNA